MFGIFLGLIVAGGCGVLLFFVVSQKTTPGASSAPTVKVVVASGPIVRGTKFGADNTTVVDRPQDQVPQQPTITYTDPTQVADKFANVDIGQGMIITNGLIVTTATSTAVTLPPLVVKDGDVAMAIPVDDQKGVGGWIQQGDHIDIIADVTGNGSLRYTLQDVPVLRIGTTAQQVAGAVPSLLVVEVTRHQAEELAFLVNGRGTTATIVRYVLRPKTQAGKDPLHPVMLPSVPTQPVCPPDVKPVDEGSCVPQTPAEQPVTSSSWSTLFPG
jgi:Flp pilus assembly protein CpaB